MTDLGCDGEVARETSCIEGEVQASFDVDPTTWPTFTAIAADDGMVDPVCVARTKAVGARNGA